MDNLHRRIGRVNSLAARTGSAADLDVQIFGLNFHIDFFCFWQNGHRAGAGVNAALGFGSRHALDSMVSAGVPLSLSASLAAALLVNSKLARFSAVFRTAFFAPVVTTLVAVA